MTTTTVPRTAMRAGMTSTRKTALVAGVLYLITFVASIPALLLIGPVLNNADYIVSGGSDSRVLFGLVLDLVNAFACIGTAVTLFPVLRRQNEGVALGFVTSRMFEGAIIATGVVSLLAVVTLRQDLGGATGAEAASLVQIGHSLVAVRDWTFILGPSLMAGVNAMLFGSLMYRSGLVPRWIPTLALIGGPLLVISTVATVLGHNTNTSPWAAISTAPIFVWELSVGLRMAFKGFRPSPITAAIDAERASRVAAA
jgi:hypothetical protein